MTPHRRTPSVTLRATTLIVLACAQCDSVIPREIERYQPAERCRRCNGLLAVLVEEIHGR